MQISLIKKEIRESLVSVRFIATIVFTIILFVSGTLAFCRKYSSQLEDYRYFRSKEEQVQQIRAQSLQAAYQSRFTLAKEPRLTLLFASGNETRYPSTIVTTPSIMGRGGLFSGDDLNVQKQNFLLAHYQDFDLVFVAGVVLSFLAIVLAYDAVSGDRERGTLRLQLSNPVPRLQILSAKYTANMVLLVAAVTPGLIFGLVILQVLIGENLLLQYTLESTLIAILGGLYLSAFVWISLWISALFSKPSTALATLLLLWTYTVVLAPYIGGMLASRLNPVESEELFNRRFQAAIRESMMKLNAEAGHAMSRSKSENEIDWKAVERGFDEAEQVMANYFSDHLNELFGQVEFAERINFTSPYGAFRQAVELMSNTGLGFQQKFIAAGQEYRAILKEFIRQQDSRDMESKHRMMWHPTLTSLSKKPVDPGTIPVFTPPSSRVSASDLTAALPSFGYLLFLNIVFAFLAVRTFIRADVR